MILRLPMGHQRSIVDLRGMRVRQLAPSAPGRPEETKKLVSRAVDNPLDGPHLETLCRGRRSVIVVVPDATREAALPEVLPVLFERVRRGSPEARVTVLVACGTHPAVPDDELDSLLGALPPGIEIEQHDSRDGARMAVVGELAPGRPLRLNRLLGDAEVVLTVGAVRHHYFAGFGGGPKMIFPGCGGYDEIQANHSNVLEQVGADVRRHAACAPGVLDGNPVADEIARAAAHRRPDMALCLVLNGDGRVAWAGAGSAETAFSAAVEKVRAWYELAEGRFKLIVGTGGGQPSDSTLIQAHKGFDAASRFLQPGGEMLFLAAIDQGLGSPEMQPYVADPDPETILNLLRQKWVQYGHTTLRIVDKTSRYRVLLVSGLEAGAAERLGFIAAADPEAVVSRWRKTYPGETVGVMTGSAVYPKQITAS